MISPAGIRRRPPAARVCSINHVIVNQRGAVDQFYDGAQPDGAASPISRVPRRKQQQRRTQTFPAPFQQVARDFRDWLDRGTVLERELPLDLDQVIANEIENFLRRQK